MATKILALADALGNPVRFRLMPGQRYNSVEVPPLIDGIAFDGLIADKHVLSFAKGAFDSNALVAELNERGTRVVISQHPGRAQKALLSLSKDSRSTPPSIPGVTASRASSAS